MAVVRGELVGKGRDLEAELPKTRSTTALDECGLENEMPEGSHFDLVLN
jgi:hypothetical protein